MGAFLRGARPAARGRIRGAAGPAPTHRPGNAADAALGHPAADRGGDGQALEETFAAGQPDLGLTTPEKEERALVDVEQRLCGYSAPEPARLRGSAQFERTTVRGNGGR